MKTKLILFSLLLAFVSHAQIVITSTNITKGSGGTQGGCPPRWTWWANFNGKGNRTGTNWGWAPITGATNLSATDTNLPKTTVYFVGDFGDSHCGSNTVHIPTPPTSDLYRFAIYGTNKPPPSNSYTLVLTNFNP